MVRPSQERRTQALTSVQSIAMGDGTDVGEDGVDFPEGTGTNPDGGVITPPAAEPVEFIYDSTDEVVLDFAVARFYDVTLTDNVAVTIINAPGAGLTGRMEVTYRQPPSGGPFGITSHPDGTDWRSASGPGGGSPPQLSVVADGVDVIRYETRDGGVTYGGTYDPPMVDGVQTIPVSGADVDLDYAIARVWDVTISENVEYTISHPPNSGNRGRIELTRRGTTGGPFTETWPVTVDWWDPVAKTGGGSAPDPLNDGEQEDVELVTFDGGLSWGGSLPFYASGGSGTPSDTVEAETTWSITPDAGVSDEYSRGDHTHGTPAEPSGSGGIGPILISDTPSTPLVFADLIQNEAQDDLVYADT